MIKKLFAMSLALVFAGALLPGSVSAQAQKPAKDPVAQRAVLHKDVLNAIENFKKSDPSMDRFFKQSAGYAVFARVGKAGLILGTGAGDGEVFEKGKVVGLTSTGYATIGLQAGIQEFSEVLFFKDTAALERFKQGNWEFAGGASIVIVKAGAAGSADYSNGVAVFAKPTGGAMAEASLGTQKFSYTADPAPAMKK